MKPACREIDEVVPELPSAAKLYFRPERLEEFAFALCDLLCWLDGFNAAGGSYSPGTKEVLRELSCNIKSIREIQSKLVVMEKLETKRKKPCPTN